MSPPNMDSHYQFQPDFFQFQYVSFLIGTRHPYICSISVWSRSILCKTMGAPYLEGLIPNPCPDLDGNYFSMNHDNYYNDFIRWYKYNVYNQLSNNMKLSTYIHPYHLPFHQKLGSVCYHYHIFIHVFKTVSGSVKSRHMFA